MGYHYNKTMFYININLTMEETMQNIKTSKKQLFKNQLQLIKQIFEIRKQKKELTQLEKMLIDNVKTFKKECPITRTDTDGSKYVLDISEQTRNVFNQSLFKEQNNDLFYKYVSPQLVEIVKVDKRNQ